MQNKNIVFFASTKQLTYVTKLILSKIVVKSSFSGMAFVLVAALQFVAGYIIWFVVLAMVLGTLVASFVCW